MKDFTLYPEAFALRELGFDEPCFGNWQDMKEINPWLSNSYTISQNQYYGQLCSAPTYSQAFRFFREKYGLQCWPEPTGSGRYCCKYDGNDETGYRWVGYLRNDNKEILFYLTYEEAELACLRKLIEIVKKA